MGGDDAEDSSADEEMVDDIEVEEIEVNLADDPDFLDDAELVEDDSVPKKDWYLRKVWQFSKLPYGQEAAEQADRELGIIKMGLAKCVLLNDASIGITHWTQALSRYLEFNGHRMTKEDVVHFIKLMIPRVRKGALFRDVKSTIRCLNTLLSKRNVVTRDDLELDWLPLYELYSELAHEHLEANGMFLLPEDMLRDVVQLISNCRLFFPVTATQQILDEVRPWICPFDDSIHRAFRVMELFLPCNVSADLHQTSGASLWLNEVWHWLTVMNGVTKRVDNSIMKCLLRVAYECPGYLQWTNEQIDYIFTRVVRSLRLSAAPGLSQNFQASTAVQIFVYLLGTKYHQKIIDHLRSLSKLFEPYVHPSTVGSHTSQILSFINKLFLNIIYRLQRERSEKSKKRRVIVNIAEEMRLKQEVLDEIVSMFLPCLKLAMFSKTGVVESVSAITCACTLSPDIVLPVIIDLVYPALETLTEPHRLYQALQVLVHVAPIMVKNKENRIHAIHFLNSLLPGLDKNDINKSLITFQFVGIVFNLIPIVDCSEAVHLREDLTEEEKELCSATANFEGIIGMFLDKCLTMLVDSGETAMFAGAHGAHGVLSSKGKVNTEDNVLHKGTLSIFKGIFRNCSSSLYETALDRVYRFAQEHIFDSKLVCDALADMIFVAVKFNPERVFPMFFKLIKRKLEELITPEIYTEERPDFQVVWWVSMAVKLCKVPAPFIREHWSEVQGILKLLAPFDVQNDLTQRAMTCCENVLESLCYIYVLDSHRRRVLYDKSPDEYLAIRHWAEPVDKKNWNPIWHVPAQVEIDMATGLLNEYFIPTLKELEEPEKLDKKKVLLRLQRLRGFIHGCAPCLPLFDGPLIPLMENPAGHQSERYVTAPNGTPEISLGPVPVRDMILEVIKKLLDFTLTEREDDVKSISIMIQILGLLERCRGVSKDSYSQSATGYRITRNILCDRLAAERGNIEMLNEEFTVLLHKKRVSTWLGFQFRQQNLDIIKIFLRLSTSYYPVNRCTGQKHFLTSVRDFPFSYKLILDDLLQYFSPEMEATHEQLKGALYCLLHGKQHAIFLRNNLDYQMKAFAALVTVKHSEKRSIIALLQAARSTIRECYESFRIKYEFYPEMVGAAHTLLEPTEGSPMNPVGTPPTAVEIEANKDNIEELYKTKAESYYRMVNKMTELCNDSELHWKQTEMAHGMLCVLLRRDMVYPTEALKVHLRMIVSDNNVRTRKLSACILGAWLMMNKPKAVKRELEFEKPPEVSAGAKWPIPYGVRDDNRFLMYETEKLPTTDEEWDNFQFCGKHYRGFYTWPKTLITYAPLCEQKEINRDESELNEIEQFILETFRDAEFLKKFQKVFTIEEKKGKESFQPHTFKFLKGLVRCIGPSMAPIFRELLEELIPSSKETDQRFACELTAAIINGSKMWEHAKQRKMWIWLQPLLTRALETVKDDNVKNWGSALATVCAFAEPRFLKPLIDILIGFLNRPTESSYATSARLMMVQESLNQLGWRAIEFTNLVVRSLKTQIVQQYANVRGRITACLVSGCIYDLPGMYRSPNIPQHLLPPNKNEIVALYIQSISSCWDDLRGVYSSNNMMEVGEGDNNTQVTEVKKQRFLAMRSFIKFAHDSMHTVMPLPMEFINSYPLFFHYCNDIGDEELQNECTRFLAYRLNTTYVRQELLEPIIDVSEQILTSSCWWKSKIAVLAMLRLIVLANMFAFKPYEERIAAIMIEALSNSQIEVREAAASALSFLIRWGYCGVTNGLMDKFMESTNSVEMRHRHGGVLGLSAIVLAFPYSVPKFIPDVLMKFCKFANQTSPLKDTVKKSLSEFKRTHQDSWHEHEAEFNEDQLCVLRDLLISPNYYV